MRWFRTALPATAFFVLLSSAAGVGYWFGTQRAGAGASKSTSVYTCSMHPQVRQDGPGTCPICRMELVPLASVPKDSGPALTIDPVVVQNMGVRVATIARGALSKTVHAFGAVREAQARQRDIALKIPGFVHKLHAHTEGMAISKGDVLFDLYSAELIVAQEELIAARKSGDAELLAAARQKLLLWDLPASLVDELQAREHAQQTIPWQSPVSGRLMRRDIVEGAPAMMNQSLLRIVDLSEVWLDAQLPEHEAGSVRLDMEVEASFAALPGRVAKGRIVYIAPAIDEATRTVTVRAMLPNEDESYRPGMFARLHMPLALAADAVLVPMEAVLDTGDRQLAWLALGDGKFEPRVLRVGRAGDGGMVEVLDGVKEGDRVVVSGQLLIDAESQLREGTRKLQGEGLLYESPGPAVREPLRLTAEIQQRVDAVLTAYLAVADALLHDKDDDDGWVRLSTAVQALHDGAPPELHELVHELPKAVPADIADVATRRRTLIPAGKLFAELFAAARPSRTFGPSLFVMHCPMVEADWLQTDEKVKNFFDLSMTSCGEVKSRLPLDTGAGR